MSFLPYSKVHALWLLALVLPRLYHIPSLVAHVTKVTQQSQPIAEQGSPHKSEL
jgi:hypothetical protein